MKNLPLAGHALTCDPRWWYYPSNLQISNCIFWDGGKEIRNKGGSIITITYSDIQRAYEGQGNIDADPSFVDAGDPNYTAAPAVAKPIGAESEYIKVFGHNEGLVRLEIAFDREAFCDLLTNDGSLELTVTGSLKTAQYFYGSDTITIIPRRE